MTNARDPSLPYCRHINDGAELDLDARFNDEFNPVISTVRNANLQFSENRWRMSSASKDEIIGRIYRTKAAHRQQLAFINSELNAIAVLFKKASCQLECLLAHERCELHSVLSQINIDHTLQLLAEREQLTRRIAAANEELKRLGVPL